MVDIRCPVSEASETSRHEPALLVPGRKIVYSEYEQYVSATASRLKRIGCREGDRVAISLENHWHYPILVMALFRCGAIACPLDPALDAGELEKLLQELRCRVLIADPSASGRERFKDRMWDPQDLITIFSDEAASDERPSMAMDQPATIIVSSGRNAGRRFVQHSFGQHYYSARGVNHTIRASSGSKWLLSSPFHEMTGMSMMIRCAFNASAIAIPGVREKLDGALESYEITHMILNAEQVRRLLEKDFDAGRFPALKAILVADGGLSPSLAHRAIERHFPIYQSYGLTETAGQVTSVGLDSPPWKRKTHGRVLKYRDLKLGEDGEVLVKGATLCDGYVEAGNVRPVVGEDGWFATGDVGRLDEDRYLTVLGRKENSFVSRGKQVQPEAVEDALCAEHGVERAVVVPVSDKKSGLRPVAFVKIAGGKTELARLPGRLRKTLQAVEIPTDFFLLPRQGPCAGREGREYLRGVAEKRLTRKTD